MVAIFSHLSYTQEINPNLLKNLTPEQLSIAQAELNRAKPISAPKPKISESTVKKSVGDMNKVTGTKYGYSFFLLFQLQFQH